MPLVRALFHATSTGVTRNTPTPRPTVRLALGLEWRVCFPRLRMTATPSTTDHWIAHPRGRLFARQWKAAPACERPDAAPLVLLHESLGCVEAWRDFPAALCRATGRTVLAYDRLGFGRSDARAGLPPLDFVAEEARDFLSAVLDALQIERFVALGHSVGGSMAIEAAAQWPRACEALIVIAAQVFPQAQTLQGIREAAPHVRAEAQVQKLARLHGDKTRWVLDAWIERWLDPAFAVWTLEGTLPRVRCPSLALYGSDDPYCSDTHPRLIAQWAGGPATVETLAGLGHLPHRDDPQLVTRRIAEFLRDGTAP